MHHDDEYLFPTSYDERERSHTPPMFAYSTYPPPPPEDMLMPYGSAPSPYSASARHPHHHQYHPATTAAETYPEYMPATTVPVTLPSMTTHFSDALKREPGFNAPLEEVPAYMSYNGYLPASPYDHMPHVSSLRAQHPPPRNHSSGGLR